VNRPGSAKDLDHIVTMGAVAVILLALLWIPTWAAYVAFGGALAFRFTRSINRQSSHQRELTIPPDALLLGEDRDHKPVVLADNQLAAHGLIVGATRSGKSTTLLRVLADQIGRGRPVVAVDLKGSPEFGTALVTAAKAAGRPWSVWTPDGNTYWNPLQYGNATELKDKLISTERWSEPHYQRAAERYLQTVLQVLHEVRPDRPVTLNAVSQVMDPERVVALLGKCPAEMRNHIGPYLSKLTRDQQSAISGLASRLAVINESHTGAWLQPSDGRDIDLRRAIADGEVVVFSLNAGTYGKLAAHIASLVIQDLNTVAGQRISHPAGGLGFVAVDEISALDADNIVNLFARAAGAGISVLLATQELADLNKIGPWLKDQVLGNIALLAAHRQNVPESAETIATMIGTDTVVQTTWQTDSSSLGALFGKPNARLRTGLGSEREVEKFRIHPNVIKELQTGEIVLISKVPISTARTVWVYSPDVPEQPSKGVRDAA
jgi:type IV secretory pathway TraG/TraD family ATPase VirD4